MERISNLRIPDATHREQLLIRIERLTELPLLVLSFIMIPLLLGPFLWELSPGEEAVFAALDSLIWALFGVDLIIKFMVTPHRISFVKRHWLEIVIVAMPFFRPLWLLRLFVFGSRAYVGARRLVHIDFLLVYGIGLVIIAATIVATVERGNPSASITSFPDALWWAVTTITTVGYGDEVPVTTAGRAVAFVLMLGGIAFYGGLTANLTALLVRSHPEQTTLTQIMGELESLRREVAGLRERQNQPQG